MAKLWTEIKKPQATALKRLSIVFADPLRLKIVTELHIHEMSATQFFQQFGGGSVSRVSKHFTKLAEHGWLELVRTESGGKRRGGTERFYRAPDLAAFDNDTWAALPYSIRVAFSWRTFEQLAERVREAMAAGTFDARPDRHFSWTPTLLDQQGWGRVIDAIDALYEWLAEAQDDAHVRLAETGEQPILTTVALGGYESPLNLDPDGDLRWNVDEDPRVEPQLVACPSSPTPLPQRLSKVFADMLCLRIVAEANLAEMSPTLFHRKFGGVSVPALDRRFKRLAEIGWLVKVRSVTGGARRGATEHFYRATGPAIFDNTTWAEVPDGAKKDYSWRTFEEFAGQIVDAIGAATFDSRPERHFTWSLLLLDQTGWERVVAKVDGLFAMIFEEQEAAKARLEKSGERPIRMTVALGAFESPQDTKREP